MSILKAKDVTFTIDGVDYAYGRDFTLEQTITRESVDRMVDGMRNYEVSAECYLSPTEAIRITEFLSPKPKGASFNTLVKRLTYGGRKGRSALRRLWKNHSIPATMTMGKSYWLYRGRVLPIAPEDIRVEMRLSGIRIPPDHKEVIPL